MLDEFHNFVQEWIRIDGEPRLDAHCFVEMVMDANRQTPFHNA
jgi:hypothetical protein